MDDRPSPWDIPISRVLQPSQQETCQALGGSPWSTADGLESNCLGRGVSDDLPRTGWMYHLLRPRHCTFVRAGRLRLTSNSVPYLRSSPIWPAALCTRCPHAARRTPRRLIGSGAPSARVGPSCRMPADEGSCRHIGSEVSDVRATPLRSVRGLA